MTKYTHKERERIRKVIRSLSKKGLGNIAIAKALNAKGFRAPDGKTKITDKLVASQKTNMRRAGEKISNKRGTTLDLITEAKAVVDPTLSKDTVRLNLIGSVYNSNLPAGEKLAIIGLL